MHTVQDTKYSASLFKNDLTNQSFTVCKSYLLLLIESHAHRFSVAICVTTSECLQATLHYTFVQSPMLRKPYTQLSLMHLCICPDKNLITWIHAAYSLGRPRLPYMPYLATRQLTKSHLSSYQWWIIRIGTRTLVAKSFSLCTHSQQWASSFTSNAMVTMECLQLLPQWRDPCQCGCARLWDALL